MTLEKIGRPRCSIEAPHYDLNMQYGPLVYNLNLRAIFGTPSERNKYLMQKCKFCSLNGWLCERYVPLDHVATAMVLA